MKILSFRCFECVGDINGCRRGFEHVDSSVRESVYRMYQNLALADVSCDMVALQLWVVDSALLIMSDGWWMRNTLARPPYFTSLSERFSNAFFSGLVLFPSFTLCVITHHQTCLSETNRMLYSFHRRPFKNDLKKAFPRFYCLVIPLSEKKGSSANALLEPLKNF